MKEKTKGVKFPEKLYVYREEDGDEVYYICQEAAEECIDARVENKKLVGVYALMEMVKLCVEIHEEAAD